MSRLSRVDQLIESIKRKQVESKLKVNSNMIGTHEIALKTSEIFRDLVEQGKWIDGKQLFESARKIGKKLIAADKMNFTIGNTVKRVYHIIREECKTLKISLKDSFDVAKGCNDRKV